MMSAWRPLQLVISTQTARTLLVPTFALEKRVLWVTATRVKVKKMIRKHWSSWWQVWPFYCHYLKRLAVFAGTVLILPFFSVILSSTIGRGPLLRPKCMGLHLSRATHLIEQASKRNNTLTIIVILVENNIIISASTLFQTLTNLQKGLMILVERPTVVTPKEATTVHVRQASLMVKPAQVITDSCLLLSLFICSIPLFAVLN